MNVTQAPQGIAGPVSRRAGDARLEPMTAKETLLARAPGWSEEQAERALLAAEAAPKSILDEWGDLDVQTDERVSGLEPWRP
jgi:hypothetical protein